MSQIELSQRSGLHRTYIGVVERGEKNITVTNCMKVAAALGIRLTDLIDGAEKAYLKAQACIDDNGEPDGANQDTRGMGST